ncbi:MAG: ribonuclease [Acidobacteriaceae bacterium]|nr:ribonuclease [Acidobacteriaceae bacterium]
MSSRSTPPGLFGDDSARPAPVRSANTEKAGWITAHCDGGARGNPGPAGYGAEVTGPDGAVIAELSEFLGIRTNNYAEYSGLLASLQYALDSGHRRLRVISDSELMVKQIQGKYKVNSPDLKPLWQEAKNRIAKLEGFEIAHALRHKNKAADALANQAMDRGMRRTTSPPPTNPGAPRPALADVGSNPAPKATPYPSRAEAPPAPKSFEPKADTMLRGFTCDGVVHILGGTTLPNGIFVKIIRE